jgi:hypothetical protein
MSASPQHGAFTALTVGHFRIFGNRVEWPGGCRRFKDKHAATKAARLLARTDCELFPSESEALGRWLAAERRALLRGDNSPGLPAWVDLGVRWLNAGFPSDGADDAEAADGPGDA